MVFKLHKSVYSCSFVVHAWHVHWRRANLEYFYLLSFICGKTLVCDCDDRDMSSLADRYKRRWRVETVVSREKCLISLPSARARRAWSCHFHLLHYFLFPSTPAWSGPLKCRLCAVICVPSVWVAVCWFPSMSNGPYFHFRWTLRKLILISLILHQSYDLILLEQ